jgi:hypothetical protein
MTQRDKERYIFELQQKLEQRDGHLTIEIDDEHCSCLFTLEWISERGYYHSNKFHLQIPSFPYEMKLRNVQRHKSLVFLINNYIKNTLDSWKEKEPDRIDSLQNQPKPKYNQHLDVDPYNEEIW